MDTARERDVFTDPRPVMPELENLASAGVSFTSAFANAPWTLPSHGTLFTGQPPSVHGAHAKNKSFAVDRTLAGELRRAGYQTVGISNNTWISGEFGFDQGFDEFYTTWQLYQEAVDFGDIAQTETGIADTLVAIARKFQGDPIKNIVNLVYGRFFRRRHDDGARRTNEIIEHNVDDWLETDSPLFLFINYLEPHLEYDPPDEYAENWLPNDVTPAEAKRINQDAWAYITGEIDLSEEDFQILRGLYRAELAYLDDRLAQLVNQFENTDRETVFIVTGDHGENIGDHDLMDHQYCLYETLLHVPLVISGGKTTKDSPVSVPVQLADLFPTILDLGGARYEESDLAGHSLLNPESIPPDRPLFAEYLGPQPAIETLQDKYECNRDITKFDRQLRAVRTGAWKFIRGSDGDEWLFNLEEDPDETENLVSELPDRRDELRAILQDWTSTLPPITREGVEMDARTKSRLEDLGYLQ